MNQLYQFYLTKQAVSFRGIPVTSSIHKFLSRMPKAQVPEVAAGLNIPKVEGYANAGNIFVSRSRTPRETVAHEWLHTVPVIGRSETAARFYGGYAQPRGAGLLQRLGSGLKSTKDYYTKDYHLYHPRLNQLNPFSKKTPQVPRKYTASVDDTDILNSHSGDLRLR